MRFSRRLFAACLVFLFTFGSAPAGKACGPSSLEPIFVFRESPDLPFEDFTKGKIGIVQPSFGRKTLVIAYRYLNGGAFSSDEQQALVEALRGKAPEDNAEPAIKAWVAARKELTREGEKLPQIYVERQNDSYDFFPNCTRNAFEVATTTLKDRLASYGVADSNVRAWAAAQDIVFENCRGGAETPDELGAGSPLWLRQDRDYQIAAALFYSLNFDEARRRFEKIAANNESPWQETAEYLIPRTLVRQASLTRNEAARNDLYQKAEVNLQNLMGRSRRFYHAAQKLLALVKYRLHPEERVAELARILANQSGNENLRQDVIDYVWLLDKTETGILKVEEERKEASKPPEERKKPESQFYSKEVQDRYEAVQRGELIGLGITPRNGDGTIDYRNRVSLDFKYDASENEIVQAFELKLARKLTVEEISEIRELREGTLQSREWLVSPNRKWSRDGLSQYEGCDYDCERLTLDLIPGYLRADDLSDWIFTLQTEDPGAYDHARARWRDTGSRAWLVVALIKARKSSRHIDGLMRDAERVGRDAPEFPTIAYELARLKVGFGNRAAARKLIDEVIATSSAGLPLSALNQFVEQRARLSESMSEFLKYSQRQAVAFYNEGRIGKLSDLLKIEEYPEYREQTREEYERGIEETNELLPWDDRFSFDAETVDILNWHLSVQSLFDAARDRAVPAYLQRELVLAAWTRAVLLQRDELAARIAPEVIKVAPEMTPVFTAYLEAPTPETKHDAALFVLLKFPSLSPYVASGIPVFSTAERRDYYFESAWWCVLPDTEYNRKGDEIPKVVSKPDFLTAGQVEEAQRERKQLVSIGDGKSYLGKQVLAWAKRSPLDPRIPEALFIAFNANARYKYGCAGWEFDHETQRETGAILRQRYPTSPWTAMLPPPEQEQYP